MFLKVTKFEEILSTKTWLKLQIWQKISLISRYFIVFQVISSDWHVEISQNSPECSALWCFWKLPRLKKFYRQKLGYNCKSGKNFADFTIFHSCVPFVTSHMLGKRQFSGIRKLFWFPRLVSFESAFNFSQDNIYLMTKGCCRFFGYTSHNKNSPTLL